MFMNADAEFQRRRGSKDYGELHRPILENHPAKQF